MSRSRALVVWGAVLIGVGVVLGIASAVLLVSGVVGGLSDAMTAPSWPTPVSVRVQAQHTGTYVVYELTPGTDDGNGFGGSTSVTPDDVRVIGPGGTHPVVEPSLGMNMLTRTNGVYTGAVQFRVDAPGEYVVEVAVPGTRVVVAQSVGSAVSRNGAWGLGIPVGGLLVLVGLVLLIVGLTRGARERREVPRGYATYGPPSAPPSQPYAVPSQPYAPPYSPPAAPPAAAYVPPPTPPGWYPDPYDPSRRRYWDGTAWTSHTG